MSEWKMVPVEPTEEMKRAAVVYANGNAVYKNVAAEALEIEEDIYGEVYAAMTAAAPPAPSAEPSEPVREALAEVERATRKFPTWPTDPLHALAVLGEEFGELTKAVLQSVYEPHKVEAGEVRTEAIQTAAMALRFLASLDRYEYRAGEQHAQIGGGR
jgi:NTP pyrophosphatase (non-canonical NTP hydrolase)